MVTNIEELKKLIIWCKEQKVKAVKLADISFELSDLALVENLGSIEDVILNEDKKTVVQKDLVDSEDSKQEDEDDLYWSTR